MDSLQPEPVSSQTVAKRPDAPQSIAQRSYTLRVNLRLLAALGAALIVLGAFLPWIEPAAQAVLGDARVAPVVQGWPGLLIGLIALGVLALPQNELSRWVSLPVAALGLAAAVIAVASALTAASAVAAVVARFPNTDMAAMIVTGAGVILTVAGGLICVAAGLSHPAATLPEAQLILKPGQPAFAIVASALVVVALISGLVGAAIGAGNAGSGDQGGAAFPTDLLSTPVIDAQVTPLGVTPEPTSDLLAPTLPATATEPPIPTPPGFPPTRTPPPAETPTQIFQPPLETDTPTATPTSETSPLETPTP